MKYGYHNESGYPRATELLAKMKGRGSTGLAGLATAVGYGAYAYKNRGAMSTSVYLMQFRVIAQGTAVGALTAGIAYTMYNNHFNKKKIVPSPVLKTNEH